MKILHMVNTYAPIGGIETYVLKLLPLLTGAGHENSLIYRQQHPRTPLHADQPIYHVPVTENPSLDRAQIREITRRIEPSIVFLHDVYDPHVIEDLAEVVPTIGYVHGFTPVCPALSKTFRRGDRICEQAFSLACVFQIYWRRCASARLPSNVYNIMKTTHLRLKGYRSLPQLIVASQYMKDLMIQNGIDPARVGILPPHFLDVSRLPEVTRPGKNNADILFVGRLEFEKGLPYLLQALTMLPKHVRLFVAGDGSLRGQYHAFAVELGLADRVHFVGWQTEADLGALYQRCTVTVVPSIMPEPFGKVGIEAMTHARPIVAFDVGGIPDWLKHGHNGFLVPPRDSERLAQAIETLLADTELAASLGENGRAFAEAHFGAQDHYARLLRFFETAVSRGIHT